MRRIVFVMIMLAGCGMKNANFPGQSFLGVKYQDSPLGEEMPPDNDPIIRFDAFDCTTFVETVLADSDKEKLNRIRYKNGQVGFLNRNHFIETDWIQNNSDIVENVSKKYAETQIRTVVIDKSNWFKKNYNISIDVPLQKVNFEYIPYQYANQITVDKPVIVLFITDNPKMRDTIGTDLAVVHMGFLMPNGVLRHASSACGKVVDVNMNEYIAQRTKNKHNLGIAVVEIK